MADTLLPSVNAKRGHPLACALHCIVALLALNALLLTGLVGGVVFCAVRIQPLVQPAAEAIPAITSTLRAVEEAEVVQNAGSMLEAMNNIHFLPYRVVDSVNSVLGLDVGSFARTPPRWHWTRRSHPRPRIRRPV